MDITDFTLPTALTRAIPHATLASVIGTFQASAPCVTCGHTLASGRFTLLTDRHADGRWLLGAAHYHCRHVPAAQQRQLIENASTYEARSFTHGDTPNVLLHPSVNTSVIRGNQSLISDLLNRSEWSPATTPQNELRAAGDYLLIHGNDDGGIISFRLWGVMTFDCHAPADIVSMLTGQPRLYVCLTLRGPVATLTHQDDLDAIMLDEHTKLAYLTARADT